MIFTISTEKSWKTTGTIINTLFSNLSRALKTSILPLPLRLVMLNQEKTMLSNLNRKIKDHQEI